MATSSVLMLSGVRKKRDPYTPVACSTCKRRKIKCTGNRPCAACVASEATCNYERYSRFRPRLTVSQTNESRGSPIRPISSPGATEPAQVVPEDKLPSAPPDAGFTPHGSSDYFLKLAEELHTNSGPLDTATQGPPTRQTPNFGKIMHNAHDWQLNNEGGNLARFIGLDTWINVINIYEEEIGLPNPFMDLDAIRDDVEAACQDTASDPSPTTAYKDHNFILLLAIVAVLENPDISQLADSFTQDSRQYATAKSQAEIVDEHTIRLLMLVSVLYFISDRETLSWRCIGNVLRILQGLGYHDSQSRPGSNSVWERARAEKLLWSAYVLDRRWSFGTGLPFGISELDIDHDFESMDDTLSSVYLKSMVVYCRIATECRSSILGPNSSRTAREFSDFRVVEWRRNLPHFLRFDSRRPEFNPSTESRSHYRLRLLLHLRANQMRTVVRRHSAFRSGPGDIDTSSMQTAIEVACDTIRILVTVVQTSDVYQAQQKTFNHFLESAFSSLLLAVGHRKHTGEPSYFEELHMVMSLVRGLAPRSWMMRKLCDKLERLKVVQAALKSRTTTAESFGSLRSSSKQTENGQAGAEPQEAYINDLDRGSTTGYTSVSDNLSSSHQGDSESIPYTSDHGYNPLEPDPEAAYAAGTSALQPTEAYLAAMAAENGHRRIPGLPYPPDQAILMDPHSFGEPDSISGGSDKSQVGGADALQYMFFADMQSFLGVQNNTFVF